jgi:hypothetical protein
MAPSSTLIDREVGSSGRVELYRMDIMAMPSDHIGSNAAAVDRRAPQVIDEHHR